MLFAAIAVPIQAPLPAMALLLMTALFLPPLFRALKLPELLGLILAGVLLGPSLFNILEPKADTVVLLAGIGKLYLMFLAGLEIDLSQFQAARDRSLRFGFATFAIPLLVGLLIGLGFGFGWNSAFLIGSLLASHTLLTLPIVEHYGLLRQRAVAATLGATIFTDIGALLVLAVCLAVQSGDGGLIAIVRDLLIFSVFITLVLYGVKPLSRWFFRLAHNNERNQFLFIFLVLLLVSLGAQAIQLDMIIGAFLAGLAVNETLQDEPVREKVDFFGKVMFLPCFFIDIGLLLNPAAFWETLTTAGSLTFAIVGGLFGSKFLAAIAVKQWEGYSWPEVRLMWSLSLPQVAATLAAAQAGLQAQLLSPAVFDSIIALVLITVLVGPLLTDRFAQQICSVPKREGRSAPVPSLD
ncbi:cation:proton antiporter [Synechococcus elongatus]|uniref:Na+/H+ antiporter n=2 Tax=Synechococcus elongatus TaxID=32046 RepID=Q8VPV2_SYNE7|nr:cation:proton antiporter [Synechococcus elongatus]AAK37770.1 NapA [Synechococcus elongatus PCC 7942 = FACHB-805]ABB56339.1 Na+/H+ antiporter [Synechococcus elongatus PCC 7942 = FACHB-805]AJD56612.1 sodium:proton antiporter [Synechococcus elongatus UTEX 2973]MBD2588172.1 cation:proton antiporter [Synechococcus elongatus FACHB-242]MBD2689240.1 cation:proton antiporter [Synechococcus elongatus FACHB-1061]